MSESDPRICIRCEIPKLLEKFKKYRRADGGHTFAKTCIRCYTIDTLARRRAASDQRYRDMLPGLLALIAAHGPIRVREMMAISPGNPQLAGQVLSRAEREGLITGVIVSGSCKKWALVASGSQPLIPGINLDELIQQREINEEMDAWFAGLAPDCRARTELIATMRGRV